VIEEIDWSVSQIISALEQLSIKDNTYIVFTSDNGPWLTYGSHAGSAKPLKDGKGTTFEGGMRVMTFFSGPGIMPGLNNDLGMQTDLLSTFITLARFIESYPSPDSFDLSDSLKQRKPSPRNFVPFYKGSELRAFRLRDHKIQYVTQGAYGQPPERQVHESPLLIDLINDVGESTNLADKNTELVTQIDTIAREFKASVDVKPSILDSQRRD
jgi:arylsulfatase A-like enzyme